MKFKHILLTLVLGMSANLAAAEGESDWPTWRGPNGNGIVGDEDVPFTWSETENIVWKTTVPGHGNSSPIVAGPRVLLTTADDGQQVQSVVCFDRETGKQLWKTDVHTGNFIRRLQKMCTHASCSAACDGERVFATFMNNDAIWTTALDLDGKQLWQTKVSDFKSQFGYGSSPNLYKSFVLVAVDNAPDNYLAALDRQTGEIVWKAPRPKHNSYVTPVVFQIGGKDQLLISGCKTVAGYDPNTGKELWSASAGAQMAVGSMVADGDLVFASGGWPQKVTACVRAGSGEVVWSNNVPTYIPSMVVYDGYLYAVTNNGVAFCWEAHTGKQAWRARLGGNFSASPVVVKGHILVPNEAGVTKVFKADPEKLEIIAENSLPGLTRATPAICGDRIFMRIADRMYCIGNAGGS